MFKNFSVPQEVMEFIRYSAFAGFIVATTLLIALDYKAFKRVFGIHSGSLKMVFIMSTVILLLLMLYIFTFLFQKLGLQIVF